MQCILYLYPHSEGAGIQLVDLVEVAKDDSRGVQRQAKLPVHTYTHTYSIVKYSLGYDKNVYI